MPVRSFCSPFRLPVGRAVCVLAAALWCAGVRPPARADIQEPIEAHTAGQRLQRRGQQRDTTPAIATAQSIQLHQGESTEIVLQAYGQVGKTVDFLIRAWPAHGTLEGLPRQVSRNTASIRYVHRAADGPGDDSFLYAVRSPNGEVSAAVPVAITVLDQPPSLVASPAELDFGTVKKGESTRATVTLENRGGGTATGRVEPPPPWTVDGVAEYHLARGETQSFEIVFQPSYGRSYVENEHFRGEEGRGVRLIGTGIGPHDPDEDVPAGQTIAGRSIAETIARENALALAAENAVPSSSVSPSSPSAQAGVASGGAARAGGANAPLDAGRPGAGVAMAIPSPVPVAGGVDSAVGGDTSDALTGGQDYVPLNEAAVKTLEVRRVGSSTLDIAWVPPRPTPRLYRVELRFLPLDERGNLRVDWRPWAKVVLETTADRVTARVSGLPEGTRQYLRVVASDDQGRLSAPSKVLMVELRQPSTWWRVTPLKTLIALLFLCLGLLIYRKWEERQILREIDESRAARDADLLYKR